MPTGIYIRTEETRRKLSEAKRGENHPFFGQHFTEEHKKKLSNSHKGKNTEPKSEEHKKKIRQGVLKHIAEYGQVGCPRKYQQTPLNINRNGIDWTDYLRKSIMLRDGFRCTECGTSQKLHIHHIDRNPQNNNTGNITTLCANCHRKKHPITMEVRKKISKSLTTEDCNPLPENILEVLNTATRKHTQKHIEKWKDVYQMRCDGYSYAMIAERLGISKQRVHQIDHQIIRYLKNKFDSKNIYDKIIDANLDRGVF